MLSDDLKVIDGASAGAWIEPGLGEEFGAVTWRDGPTDARFAVRGNRSHRTDSAHCFFGLCTIQVWEDQFSADELRQPLLELPMGRGHIVLTGPLSAIDQIN